MSLRSRCFDYVLYITIGLAVVGVVYVAATTPSVSSEVEKFTVWLGAISSTLVVAYYSLANNQGYGARRSTWLVLIALALIQMVIARLALAVNEWKVLWWLPIVTAELIAVDYALKRLNRR